MKRERSWPGRFQFCHVLFLPTNHLAWKSSSKSESHHLKIEDFTPVKLNPCNYLAKPGKQIDIAFKI